MAVLTRCKPQASVVSVSDIHMRFQMQKNCSFEILYLWYTRKYPLSNIFVLLEDKTLKTANKDRVEEAPVAFQLNVYVAEAAILIQMLSSLHNSIDQIVTEIDRSSFFPSPPGFFRAYISGYFILPRVFLFCCHLD